MQHTQVALPDLDYLARIGEVAYTVSSLEWTVLGDLNRLTDDLPDTLTLDDVEPAMTSSIASGLKAATAAMEDGPTKDYLVAAYRALFDASAVRNDILHARPAIHPDGSQRLLRAQTVNRRTTSVRFCIDDDWLDAAITKLEELRKAVDGLRPAIG